MGCDFGVIEGSDLWRAVGLFDVLLGDGRTRESMIHVSFEYRAAQGHIFDV